MEVAARGGFNVNITTIKLQPPETVTQLILRTVNMFDLFVVVKPESAERRSKGIIYTASIADGSFVLITNSSTSLPKKSDWAFLSPFTSSVWLYIFLVILGNTIIFYIIQPHHHDSSVPPYKFYEIFYGYFSAFTNYGGLDSQTLPESILLIGFSVFLVMILAAYTANLASVLTVTPQTMTTLVDIDQANTIGASICVVYGSLAVSILQSRYPLVKIIQIPNDSTFAAIRSLQKGGICSGAVVPQNLWDGASLSSDNPGKNPINPLFYLTNYILFDDLELL